MALAASGAQDLAYAEAEETLAELEVGTTLSFEARRKIERVTGPDAGAAETP
jgi:hypothetical protein